MENAASAPPMRNSELPGGDMGEAGGEVGVIVTIGVIVCSTTGVGIILGVKVSTGVTVGGETGVGAIVGAGLVGVGVDEAPLSGVGVGLNTGGTDGSVN